MKKIHILLIVLTFIITGCKEASTGSKSIKNENQVEKALKEGMSSKTETQETKKENIKEGNNDSLDIDLIQMNSEMIYATMYQIVLHPEDYKGKKIRIKGEYLSSKNEDTNISYNFCVIRDATACCAQGMEFIMPETISEIELNKTIVLVGTIETYKEKDDETIYTRIKDVSIENMN